MDGVGLASIHNVRLQQGLLCCTGHCTPRPVYPKVLELFASDGTICTSAAGLCDFLHVGHPEDDFAESHPMEQQWAHGDVGSGSCMIFSVSQLPSLLNLIRAFLSQWSAT